MKLKNKGMLWYDIVKYDKSTGVMTVRDPHTQETFKLYDVKSLLKAAEYKIVR